MLQMIGCSHHDAAVEFRERVSFATDQQIQSALGEFRNRFPSAEVVLLSTCNRVELYAAGDSSALSHEDVASFLAQQRQLSTDEVINSMIYRSGNDAVAHLFTVAASLDSMVVGESQILFQVKQAYDLACESGSAGTLTHSVFQAANRAAKRVQNETAIHRRRVSVPSVAIGEVVPDVFDSLSGKRVVLVGAGEMGTETLRYLKQGGGRDIVVVNRNLERAANLASEWDAKCAPLESLSDQLTDCDLLIGTTSANEPLLTADQFKSIHAKRQNRLMLILDLAVPRDFDVAIGDLPNIYLYQIDDLQMACERNRREREKEWPKAKEIIAEETQRFMQELNHRATGPVIRRLRQQAQELKQEELARLMNKLQPNGNEPVNGEVGKEIEKSFDRLINKLLHPPLASLRDDAAEGHQRGLLDALRDLFKLGDE